MIDFTRLKSWLLESKLQRDNNSLYQVILNLIDGVAELANKPAAASTAVKVLNIDTTSAPVIVDLNASISGLTIIKDFKGNAGANVITLTGTVDGVVNPVINTNYGVMRVYAAGGEFLSW